MELTELRQSLDCKDDVDKLGDHLWLDDAPLLQPQDVPTKFNNPHTIFALLCGFLVIVLFLRRIPQPETLEGQFGRALIPIVFSVAMFFAFQGRDPVFQWPHPVVWRLLNAFQMIYGCFMLFLAFMPIDYGRQFMTYIDPTVGIPLEAERDYAGSCAITKDIVMEVVNDEFFLAHVIGWWLKALILRDYALLWITSILFELVERTFNHVLDNFNECWWDSWIIDVLLCNGIGIWLGMITCEYLSVNTFSWLRPENMKKKKSILSRIFSAFRPYSFAAYRWSFRQSMWRFTGTTLVGIMLLVVDTNAFFLKTPLWLPPTSPPNFFRLLFWCLCCLPAAAELYNFVDRPDVHKLGPTAWLCLFMVGAELVFIGAHCGYLFIDKPLMYWKYGLWLLGLFIWFLYGFWCCWLQPKLQENNQKVIEKKDK